jgi:hypothetical protein
MVAGSVTPACANVCTSCACSAARFSSSVKYLSKKPAIAAVAVCAPPRAVMTEALTSNDAVLSASKDDGSPAIAALKSVTAVTMPRILSTIACAAASDRPSALTPSTMSVSVFGTTPTSDWIASITDCFWSVMKLLKIVCRSPERALVDSNSVPA